MILLHWYSETKCGEWFGRVRLGRFLFCLLIVLCFRKWWITKMDCAKNGEVFQTAKMVTKHHSRIFPSVTSKGLHFYTEFTAHKLF